MQQLHKFITIILGRLSSHPLSAMIHRQTFGILPHFLTNILRIQPLVGLAWQRQTNALLRMGEMFRKIISQLQKTKEE